MMRIKALLILLISLSLLGFSLFQNSAVADTSLSVGGVTLSVPANIYEPIGNDAISANLSFSNQSGKELLHVGYSITDSLGKLIASNAKVGVPVGASGLITSYWYGSNFTKAVKPLTITLEVKDYFGVGDLIASAPLVLLAQPGAQPTPTVTVTARPVPTPTVTVTAQPEPAPTVTVTAQPEPAPTVTVTSQPTVNAKNLNAQIAKLMSQVTTLKLQMNKICSARPRPKGC